MKRRLLITVDCDDENFREVVDALDLAVGKANDIESQIDSLDGDNTLLPDWEPDTEGISRRLLEANTAYLRAVSASHAEA